MKETKNTPHVINLKDLEKKFIWKQVSCLTWARPSWRLHLGHYVWALKNWLVLQDNPNIATNFLIADYQVLGDHLWETETLRQSVIDMVIDWLSIWLDPEKSNFIVQSYVPEFAELFNYLTMFVPYSLATNNPTLKDEMKKIKKRETSNSSISLGFINYPVSQVADIMLLNWWIVPVWDDQVPHIELARKVIKKVNKMYNLDYPLPLALLSENPRLVWIDWNDKMSKSLWNTIYLTATSDEIKKQVNKMYTDPNKTSIESKWNTDNHVVFSYLDIFHEDKNLINTLKRKYIDWWKDSVWDWELKKILISKLEEIISPIRQKRIFYENNLNLVIGSIEKWSKNARITWQQVIFKLRKAMWVIDYGK